MKKVNSKQNNWLENQLDKVLPHQSKEVTENSEQQPSTSELHHENKPADKSSDIEKKDNKILKTDGSYAGAESSKSNEINESDKKEDKSNENPDESSEIDPKSNETSNTGNKKPKEKSEELISDKKTDKPDIPSA